MGTKKSGYEKVWVQKKGYEKKFGYENMWVRKKIGYEKNLGTK